MKKASRTWLPGTFGALVGIAIVAAFGRDVVSGESETIRQALYAGATLGQAVAQFTALGFVLGLAAFGLRRFAAHLAEAHRVKSHLGAATVPTPGAGRLVTIPRLADATASEFDDRTLPAFAPVTSLTEAQVERERSRRRGYAGARGHSARLR